MPYATDSESIRIILGDIGPFGTALQFLKATANDFYATVFVLGNHDFWKQRMDTIHDKYRKAITDADIPNTYLLENSSVVIDQYKFIGATLWVSYDGAQPHDKMAIRDKMADFKKIRTGPQYHKIRLQDLSLTHSVSRQYIANELAQSRDFNTVVLTHHCPLFNLMPDDYKQDDCAFAYGSPMEDFITEHKPDIWLHGHLHLPVDKIVGSTRIICNPYGHPKHDTGNTFRQEPFNLDLAQQKLRKKGISL
jgi:predicted phosphohydrolase